MGNDISDSSAKPDRGLFQAINDCAGTAVLLCWAVAGTMDPSVLPGGRDMLALVWFVTAMALALFPAELVLAVRRRRSGHKGRQP